MTGTQLFGSKGLNAIASSGAIATLVGDWLGILLKSASSLESEEVCSPIFRGQDLAINKPENQELIRALLEAIAGVEFSWQNFFWELAEQRSVLIHNLLDSARIITTNEAQSQDLLGIYRQTLESEANCLLRENLTNMRLDQLGKTSVI